MNLNMHYHNEEVSLVAFKKDTCDNLSEPCVECQLQKREDTQETNKLRQLLLDQKVAKDKAHRKLVGGTK